MKKAAKNPLIELYLHDKSLGLRYAGAVASPNTVERYRMQLDRMEKLLGKSLEDFTLDDGARIIEMVTERGDSPRFINLMMSAARGFYEWGIKTGNLKMRVSPFDGIMMRKIRQEIPTTLSDAQFKRLIDAIMRTDAEAVEATRGKHGISNAPWVNDQSRTGRKILPIKLMYHGGLRINEACSLETKHVLDLEGGIIVVGKGNYERFVPLPKKLMLELREFIDTHVDGSFVFQPNALHRGDATERHVQPHQIYQVFKKGLDDAGLPTDIKPHSLRHAFATKAMQITGRQDFVQDVLGHKNPATTRIYARNFRPDIKKLAQQVWDNEEGV